MSLQRNKLKQELLMIRDFIMVEQKLDAEAFKKRFPDFFAICYPLDNMQNTTSIITTYLRLHVPKIDVRKEFYKDYK